MREMPTVARESPLSGIVPNTRVLRKIPTSQRAPKKERKRQNSIELYHDTFRNLFHDAISPPVCYDCTPEYINSPGGECSPSKYGVCLGTGRGPAQPQHHRRNVCGLSGLVLDERSQTASFWMSAVQSLGGPLANADRRFVTTPTGRDQGGFDGRKMHA